MLRTSGSPDRRDPSSTLSGLQIWSESDEDVSIPTKHELAKDDAYFKTVAAIINLGLEMFGTKHSREILAQIGRDAVTHWKNFQHIYEDELENMSHWVNFFQASLRQDFPPVILTNRLDGDALSVRGNWAKGGRRMHEWEASKAINVYLDKTMIDNIVTAGSHVVDGSDDDGNHKKSFEGLIFMVTVTIAHELTHAWIGLLTGYRNPATPPEVTFEGGLFNMMGLNGLMGESGRVWEGLVLGGFVEAWKCNRDPLGNRQAGIIYAINSHREAREVKWDCIQNVLAYRFAEPLETAEPSMAMSDIFKQRELMTHARKSHLPQHLRDGWTYELTVPDTEFAHDDQNAPSYELKGQQFVTICLIPQHPEYLYKTAA